MTAATLFAAMGLQAAFLTAPIKIDTVFVGDAGNAADTRTPAESGTPGTGAVGYDYYIGKYEVTAGQYTAFLNAMAATDTNNLYNIDMAGATGCGIIRSGVDGSYIYTVANGNVPVNFVSVYDAMRFCNWVSTGNTESGVYDMSATSLAALLTRDATAMADGGVAIASLNEWYKAAFYNGNTKTYYTYAGTNSLPTAGTDSNFSNVIDGTIDVGTYDHFNSYYGTFDQNGNVLEWTDTIVSSTEAFVRGGGFTSAETSLRASANFYNVAASEFNFYGFRVTSLQPIPEPSTYAAIFGALALAVAVYRRRK